LLTRDETGAWSTPWDESTADYAELPLPRAVEQTIARRLDDLSPSGRQTIQLAAVLGERFGFDLLGAAGSGEPQSLLAAVRQLVQRRFLDETERDYHFSHDKVRQVAYDGIDAPLRYQLHRQVAQAFEVLHPERVATLAHHWMQAEEWEKAADYHQQAGDRAREVYANAEAVAHYSQALAALERRPGPVDLGHRYDVLLAREAVYDVQGRREAQAEDLTALKGLAEQLEDDRLQAARRWAELYLRQAKYARKMGDYPAAITEAQTAIQFSQMFGDAHSEAAGHLLWGVVLELQGGYKAARVQLERALILAQQVEDHRLEADSLRSLGNVCLHTLDFATSGVYYEKALPICHKTGDRQGEASTLNNLGLVCLSQGDNAGAEAYLRQTVYIRRELGDRWGENVALHNLGLVSWNQGDHTRSKAFYQQALAVSRGIGDPQGESIALSNLARIHHYQGNDESAREYAQRSLSIAQEIGYRYVEGYALTYLGHARGRLGQWAEAADVYREAIALRRELGQHKLVIESQAGLVRVCLAQGELLQAQALVDEILPYLKNEGLDGMVEPFQVYLTCYHVLQVGDDPRTPEVLTNAHDLLQEQAARIPDEETRILFLEEVAAHREIVAAYHELQAGSQGRQVQVRLPRAGAPRGRPLRDDEYVTVTWTVATPEDTGARKATRRRRIVRLLREAQAQGAAPSYSHLAEALGVSQRTIERDMAALSREHPDLPSTRGKMSA
jgi:tetratricopeptide (TPR) repeat protein